MSIRIAEKVRWRVEAILAEQDKIEVADVVALIALASFDDKGHINSEGLQALKYVGKQYENRMSDKCRLMFPGMVSAVANDPSVFVQDVDHPKPKRSRTSPRPAQPKVAQSAPVKSKPVLDSSEYRGPGRGSQFRMCGACAGTGYQTCSSCSGRGYHTYSRTRTRWDNSVEYYDENIPCSCTGGQTRCYSCGGTGRVAG